MDILQLAKKIDPNQMYGGPVTPGLETMSDRVRMVDLLLEGPSTIPVVNMFAAVPEIGWGFAKLMTALTMMLNCSDTFANQMAHALLASGAKSMALGVLTFTPAGPFVHGAVTALDITNTAAAHRQDPKR